MQKNDRFENIDFHRKRFCVLAGTRFFDGVVGAGLKKFKNPGLKERFVSVTSKPQPRFLLYTMLGTI